MNTINLYDYAIVGAGAAGLQLAYELLSDPLFADALILIVDKEEKEGNDHTWSYWEKGKGRYDHILWKSWTAGTFHGTKDSKSFDLDPYIYKTLRSHDFYAFMKKVLNHRSITWVTEEVLSVRDHDNHAEIGTNQNNYRASHCFDSRLSKEYLNNKTAHIRILQHFKGWIIKAAPGTFDPDRFVMMDYRLQHKDHTSFTYVLPQDDQTAMVEFTLFDDEIMETEQYDDYLKKYITAHIGIQDYEILEEEYGVIPMTTYPFHQEHTPHITKIGTAGGWVRGSSGYSFKNAMTNVSKIRKNLLLQRKAYRGIGSGTQRWMDHIFLSVLDKENERGSDIFHSIYLNNPIQSTLRFMDEDSSLWLKLKMIFSVPWGPFLRALGRWWRGSR